MSLKDTEWAVVENVNGCEALAWVRPLFDTNVICAIAVIDVVGDHAFVTASPTTDTSGLVTSSGCLGFPSATRLSQRINETWFLPSVLRFVPRPLRLR